MLTALRMIFAKVSDALAIILNLDIMLNDQVTVKMYWLVAFWFVINMFIVIATYYLKGVPDSNGKH